MDDRVGGLHAAPSESEELEVDFLSGRRRAILGSSGRRARRCDLLEDVGVPPAVRKSLITTGWMTPKNSEIDRPDNLRVRGAAGAPSP